MNELVLVVGGLVLFVLTLLIIKSLPHRRRSALAAWESVGPQLGLPTVAPGHMHGTRQGSEVDIVVVTRRDDPAQLDHVKVEVGGGLPRGLVLDRGLPRDPDGDISAGPSSDNRYEALLLALFDAPTLARVRRLLDGGAELSAGRWRLTWTRGVEGFARRLDDALATAAHIRAVAGRVVDAIAEQVVAPDTPKLRRVRAFHFLRLYHGEEATTRRTFERALAIDDVCIDAAVALARDDVLAAIACDRARDAAVRGAALQELAHKDAPALSEVVAALLPSATREPREVALPLAHVLAKVPHPEAEALLVRWLDPADDALQEAAIRALARFGTLASVVHLVPVRDRTLGFGYATSGLAKQAILAIQARAGGGETGALALAGGGETGALALAEAVTADAPPASRS